VADELVQEFLSKKLAGEYDEKNIRRRVYDALNVLMAMDIVSKACETVIPVQRI
jgi:hypothetical protein